MKIKLITAPPATVLRMPGSRALGCARWLRHSERGLIAQGRTRETTRSGQRLRRAAIAFALALCTVSVVVSSATAANFTWSGAGIPSEYTWASGANWGGTAPSGSVGTLAFPKLTSAACTAKPPTATCYTGENTLSGLTVNEITLDDGAPYNLTGQGITLGAGGLHASTTASAPTETGAIFPITLGASQTWSIDGNEHHGQLRIGEVTGSPATLTLDLAHTGGLDIAGGIGNMEAGAITIAGANSSDTGAQASKNGTVFVDSEAGREINASDGEPVKLTDAEIFDEAGPLHTGPLTVTGGAVKLGGASAGAGSALGVNGAVSFDAASELELHIYQVGETRATDTPLTATGNVDLASAKLALAGASGPCPALGLEETFTLVSTTGTITGTFNGIPNGAVVPLSNCTGSTPALAIHYNIHSVTATVVGAGFTWAGAAPAGTANWSNAANWGGVTPSGTVETLAFPALTSPACTAKPATATCYTSNNDVSGLEVNALSIDDGVPYNITGNGITLGSGGITAAPSASDATSSTRPVVHAPITLSAPQTWSIIGGSLNQQLDIEAPVTGGNSDTLAINFAEGTFLGLYADTEVGAVTATGTGTIALVRSTATASLNATDGNTVSLTGGAGLFTHTAKIGPLTMNEGSIQIGQGSDGSSPDGSLTVSGGVTLASAGTLFTFIDHSGTTPATDYTQLSATGTVNLASAGLRISDGYAIVGGKAACAQLTPGDVDTLLTTTGAITGTFANAPNEATISLECYLGATGSTTPPTVKIDYTEHTVTATVETPGSGPSAPTTTTLSANSAGPVTNQPVTLTATVTASSGTPSGTVGFDNNGTPIAGCSSQPVSVNGSSYIATCQTTFAATSSPEALTAAFTSATGSGLAGSTSAVDNLAVGRDATSTALAVSTGTPAVGESVTYTATVTPAHAGSAEPSGSVEFLDGGTPIGACASQPLTAGVASSTATCTLSYPAAGAHSITGTYLADSNFTGSSSAPAQTVTVQSKSEGGGPPGESHGAGATSGGGVLAFKSNVLPARETVTLASGTVTIRLNGTSTFVPLSGSSTIPDGSEVDATNGRVVITVTTASGKTVSAEVYGGRFRVHQDSSGETHFILTLPLTGCPKAALPHGAAARLAKRSSGPKSRHLWASETGGSWGTNGRYVSTTVQGTTWLTLDECTRSEVKVVAGKVKVLDLVRRKTKTVSAGGSYVAKLTPKGRRK